MRSYCWYLRLPDFPPRAVFPEHRGRRHRNYIAATCRQLADFDHRGSLAGDRSTDRSGRARPQPLARLCVPIERAAPPRTRKQFGNIYGRAAKPVAAGYVPRPVSPGHRVRDRRARSTRRSRRKSGVHARGSQTFRAGAPTQRIPGGEQDRQYDPLVHRPAPPIRAATVRERCRSRYYAAIFRRVGVFAVCKCPSLISLRLAERSGGGTRSDWLQTCLGTTE